MVPDRWGIHFDQILKCSRCRPSFRTRIFRSWTAGARTPVKGRWTINAAVDEAVPVPVLTTALYERFSSRGEADFANKLLSAMRHRFGGHLEKSDDRSKVA